jgi:hypothetical protein
MNKETYLAVRESCANSASEEYFDARPHSDDNERRRVFYAGHCKGYDAASELLQKRIYELESKAANRQTWIDEVLAQVQVFASAWSLVGGRFDNGDMLDQAKLAKAELREMLIKG